MNIKNTPVISTTLLPATPSNEAWKLLWFLDVSFAIDGMSMMSLPFRLPLLLRVRLVGEFDIADVGGATSLVAQEIRFGGAGELTVTKLETNCIVSLCPDGSRFLWEFDDTLVNHDTEGMSAESSEYVMVTANREEKSGLNAVVFDVGNGAVKP